MEKNWFVGSSAMHVIPKDERIYPTYKIARLATLLGEQGINPIELVSDIGVTLKDLWSNTTKVSRRQLIQVYRNAIRMSSKSEIGILTGSQLSLTDYGIYGYGLISSGTLRQALEFSIKYHQMATPTVRMSLLETPGGVAIFRMEDQLDVVELLQFNIEMQFGLVFSLFKEMAGRDFRFSLIRATFPKPCHVWFYDEIFGCSFEFDAAHNELCFECRWLDAPLYRANPITAATARELCDQVVLEMQTCGGIIGAVYGALTKDLRGMGRLEAVAAVLNMSPRTLSRKLAVQGTSFKALLNEVRCDLAVEFLKSSAMSTEDIADRLGFSDSASFRHAFKKWTSCATGRFR